MDWVVGDLFSLDAASEADLFEWDWLDFPYFAVDDVAVLVVGDYDVVREIGAFDGVLFEDG